MTPTQPNTQEALRRLLALTPEHWDFIEYVLTGDNAHTEWAALKALKEALPALAASPKNDSAQWAMEAAKVLLSLYGRSDAPYVVEHAAAIIAKHCPQGSAPAQDSARLDWLDDLFSITDDKSETWQRFMADVTQYGFRKTISQWMRADAAMATKEAK
jgi:hypothetical protein